MIEKNKDIEFIAAKSTEFVDKQISAYRQQQANSGSIMAIVSLFIPFFLNGLDDAYFWIKIISIIPIALFFGAICLFISVLKGKPLDQGFDPDKYQELINKESYEKVLMYEIGANKKSFDENKVVSEKTKRIFHRGINITIAAVCISVLILLTNKFVKPQRTEIPVKVRIAQ